MGFVRQDLARAGQLLDEAGWRVAPGGTARTQGGAPAGAPLRFRVLWFGEYRPVAEALQAQWGRLGAAAQVEGTTDYGFADAKFQQGDWDVLLGTYSTFGDPAPVLTRFVSPEGDANRSQLRDDQLVALLAEFAGLLDPEARRLHALKVNERQAEVAHILPLTQAHGLHAVSRKVHNHIPNYPLFSPYDVHPDLWAEA
jgi:ABC-type transport system substrate-binding protein